MKQKLKITFNAPLVLGFALVCTAVTLVRQLAGREVTDRLFATYAAPWSDPMMYVRLFTHVIVHADFQHLVGNMAYILLLGPLLSDKYGWKKLLAVMLVTAAVTGLIHNLLFPNTYLMGASGIVFAFILLTAFNEVREGELPLSFILVALIYLGQQVWDGLFVRDNISNLTHILGGLIGGAAGYILNMRNGGRKIA